MVLRIRAGAARLRLDDFPEADPDDTLYFPEIDCVRPLLSADVLAGAERRAEAVGVGADRVLIASGALSEETCLRALGATLGVEFEPLDGVPRAQCPIDNERLIESGAAGLLPLTVDDSLYLVVAPRGNAARQILRLIEDNPSLARQFRFTTAERLNRFVLRCAGKALIARASDQLRQKWPALSAALARQYRSERAARTFTGCGRRAGASRDHARLRTGAGRSIPGLARIAAYRRVCRYR